MNKKIDEFKIEREYEKIWDTIRTKQIEYLYTKTKDIIDILQDNIDDKMLFHKDYMLIEDIFVQMKRECYFYSSKNAKELLCLVDSKFKTIYQFREFQEEIIYIGSEHKSLTQGKKYISTHFNGAVFRLVDDKNNTLNIGRTYFKILGDN
jgi:hypothetical protein